MRVWAPLLGLAVTLALLLVVERWIHRHLQGTMFLLAGDREIAVMLYALPLLPGIFLHEMSHALVARLLGVRVGRISVRPKLAKQRIQLGFVPIEQTDVIRASLIGLAPLLVGSAVILMIGYFIFDIGAMGETMTTFTPTDLLQQLRGMLETPDLWFWAYLIFAIGNTMLPSRSDRQAWTPVLLFLLLLGVLVWAVGIGPTLIEEVSHPLTLALRWLTVTYIFVLVADLPFVLLIALLEGLVGRVKGMRVEY